MEKDRVVCVVEVSEDVKHLTINRFRYCREVEWKLERWRGIVNGLSKSTVRSSILKVDFCVISRLT